ncbi:MAG: ABC-F family ATP-binding cassette domain-containing protein [Bdellovibrionales bacterium]|nr:ABC-F family ATP-binding cassette domain-containing protein [Bdellovibrionales bacterium]
MIHFSNVSKHYGNKSLYSKASFQLNPGEKVGLVGPNGAGKTTIFRLMVGEELPDEGQVVRPDKLTVGYFSQNIEEMKGRTVIDEVKAAAGNLSEIELRLAELEGKMCEPLSDDEMAQVLDEYGHLQSEFEAKGGYDLSARAAEIVTGLGFHPDFHHRPTESFSGGWKMRIALAKILILNPDVLLMDEPTNHLDLESIEWLEAWIQQFKGSVLMTSHDRDFMNRIVSKVLEVAHQAVTVYGGNYDFYEAEREVRRTQLIAAAKRQEDMLAKEEEFIARFAARASHAAQVQSRVKKLEKIERIEVPQEERSIQFEWPEPPRSGEEVFKFEDLTKYYQIDEGKDLKVFENLTGLVKRLDRIAVTGVNGAGKSTFLKIVTGTLEPTSGTYKLGAGVELGYFSQNSLDVLDQKNTIVEEVHGRFPTQTLGYIRNLLGAFKFSGDEVEKKISVLSGGEKSRVVLATILAQPVNFLVLDEPTNHLDIQSREVLLEAVKIFPGTVMVVSHDRHFLRNVTNRVFHLDHQELHIYDGTWDEYLSRISH